jgi:hypothetical protein
MPVSQKHNPTAPTQTDTMRQQTLFDDDVRQKEIERVTMYRFRLETRNYMFKTM